MNRTRDLLTGESEAFALADWSARHIVPEYLAGCGYVEAASLMRKQPPVLSPEAAESMARLLVDSVQMHPLVNLTWQACEVLAGGVLGGSLDDPDDVLDPEDRPEYVGRVVRVIAGAAAASGWVAGADLSAVAADVSPDPIRMWHLIRQAR